MASIGGYTVDVLRGTPQLSGIELRVKAKAGVDGESFLDVGWRGRNFEIETLTGNNAEQILTNLKMAYNALKGSLVTVVDHHGQSWTNLMVMNVEVDGPKRMVGAVGFANGGTFQLTTKWTLRPCATSYSW